MCLNQLLILSGNFSPGMNTNRNKDAKSKKMQNLKMDEAKSTSMTTGVGSNRNSSFNYTTRSNEQDESEEDDSSIDDEEIDEDEALDDDDDVSDENDVSEEDTESQDKSASSSGMAPVRRKKVTITSDVDEMKDKFASENQQTETESVKNTSGDENQLRRSLEVNDGTGQTANYDNYELDDDIDSENLTSDEEDDNE